MKDNFIANYFRSSLEELTKVTWPTKNQAIKLTIIVFVFCLVSIAFLWLADQIFNLGYEFILRNASN